MFSQNSTPDTLLLKYQKSRNDSIRVYALREIINYWNTSNCDSSIYYAKKLIIQAPKIQNDPFTYKGYYWVINCYGNEASYDSSLRYAFQGLRYFENKPAQYPYIVILILTGEQYRAMAMYENSINYLEKAWKRSNETGYTKLLPSVTNRLAAVNYEYKKSDEAMAWADSSLKISKEYKIYTYYLSNLNIKGAILRDRSEYENAIEVFDKALAYAEETRDSAKMASIFNNIATTYRHLENYQQAIINAKKAFEYADLKDLTAIAVVSAEILANAYAQIKEYKKAYEYARIYENLRNDIFFEERDQQIAELNTKYETEQKENLIEIHEINLEKKDLKIRQNNLVFTFFVILLILMITFLIFRHRSNLKLKKTYNKLQELDDYKQATTKMLVHDLKNPLNMLVNIDAFNDEDERQLIVRQSSAQMLNLVMNMLDVSKAEDSSLKLSLQKIELNDVISMAMKEVDYLAQNKSIKINIDELKNYRLDADKELLMRVFTNLLTNAIKFSPDKSSIRIKTKITEKQVLRISVSDEGPGIEKIHHKLIFEQFKQVKNVKSGHVGSTGLGLAFCKLAVEAHDWDIGVNSEVGQGAEFWIELDQFESLETESLNDNESIPKEKTAAKLNMNESEYVKLKPYIDILRDLQVYAFSDIKSTLEDIRNLNINDLEDWLSDMQNAAENLDEKKYISLIKSHTK